MAIRILTNEEVARDQERAFAERRRVDHGYKSLAQYLARPGRPPSGKQIVTLRLSPEVVAKFKATGPGWQARINEALKAVKL